MERIRRKEKQKQKEDEKQKKKEEDKQKKNAEKEKERLEKEKKKQLKVNKKTGSVSSQPTLEEFSQSEDKPVPLFIEKCVKFIEGEGLKSEGLYRVPGNRAHVEELFKNFEEGKSVLYDRLSGKVSFTFMFSNSSFYLRMLYVFETFKYKNFI